MVTTTTPATVTLSSSLRTRSAEESLSLAATIARSRGVVRVVDITWLDCIGIPVYASVRPDAHRDSLAVHAGKGYTHAEAQIGAYMEGIEFSFSQPGRSAVEHFPSTPQAILESFRGAIQFLDFCPRIGTTVQPDEPMAAVHAEEICAGLGPVLIPAELFYTPFPGNPGQQLYGTSTNGLASGNTLEEATVHGLAEVLERDVSSFATIGAPSFPVVLSTLPTKLRDMVERIERAGLKCVLRYNPNPFELPHFSAYVVEPEGPDYATLTISAGVGMHCNADIAAVRAIAEAVQSRVTTIHGGRDDLMRQHDLARKVGAEQALQQVRRTREAVLDGSSAIRFEELPCANAKSVAQAQAALFEGMARAGLHHVARVVYTRPDYPFQVVRIVVPGAEFYEHALQRVGPRLMQYFKEQKSRR